jgi:hypothetical protein
MRFYWLLLGVLGVWRLTHLFQAEDGPGDLIVRLRRRVGDGFWGSLIDCFNCLSLWIAVPFAYLLGEAASERLFLWPALSGAAILLQRVTQREAAQPPAVYYEEPTAPGYEEKGDENVLRSEQTELPPGS